MEVIPSIDLRGGRVVRLEQGDYARETVYSSDPLDATRRIRELRPPRLHVVDLEAARDGVPTNLALVAQIVSAADPLPVQVGGGVRDLARVEELIGLGADRVVIGTAAIERPELLREAALRFPGRIVLGIDSRGGKLAVRGWTAVHDTSPGELLELHRDLPLAAALYTEIGRDGMLQGPDIEGTERLARASKIPVLASGGVSSVSDLLALARTRVIAGAILGRALYTGAVNLEEALTQVAAC